MRRERGNHVGVYVRTYRPFSASSGVRPASNVRHQAGSPFLERQIDNDDDTTIWSTTGGTCSGERPDGCPRLYHLSTSVFRNTCCSMLAADEELRGEKVTTTNTLLIRTRFAGQTSSTMPPPRLPTQQPLGCAIECPVRRALVSRTLLLVE